MKSRNLPLELTYKAEVFQRTGIDWNNVKLRFSNGNPNQTGVAPELRTWNLTYARYTAFENAVYGYTTGPVGNVKGKVVDEAGDALPGVNVVVKGTTVGTVTDSDGNYSITLPNSSSRLVFSFIGMTTLEIPANRPQLDAVMKNDVTALDEVVVTGYALQGQTAGVTSTRLRGSAGSVTYAARIVPTTVIENQTTVEIEVVTPYSVRSNGEKLQVELRKYEIPALYQYYTVPKLDKDAFLVARVTNWDQYSLLEGEANLYFEDAYVGRSILNARALNDTLDISLGRDKSIVIGREKSDQFVKRRAIGSNILETIGFKIIARNKKGQRIKLTIFDQVPVSLVSDISVSATEVSGGSLDDKTGRIRWDLDLEPQLQKDLMLLYEVKYPRREKVLLE